MRIKTFVWLLMILLIYHPYHLGAQTNPSDSTHEKWRKNIVRYNLSGALLFGFDRYIVLGYERVINKHQSFSINMGVAGLPKLLSVSTDSFTLNKEAHNSGFNLSADYRFYLAKENKYYAPHGLYIGPYYSFNHFHRENDWSFKNPNNNAIVQSKVDLTINTVGGELGYQFILWNRFAIDLVLIGPGIGFYSASATFENNLTDAQKVQLQQAIEQILTQRFPGMNYVFSGKTFNANGHMSTNTIGFRYIIHIGFAF